MPLEGTDTEIVLDRFTVNAEPDNNVKVIGAAATVGLPIIRLSPPALAKLVVPIFQIPLKETAVVFLIIK